LIAATGCGRTTDESAASANGSAGANSSGNADQSGAAGAPNAGAGGSATATGGSSDQGGVASVGGSSANAGGGAGGAACMPVPHTRPTPGTLSRSFADISAGVVGVYLIDAVFDQDQDCAAMCNQGNALDHSYFGYRYVSVQNPNGNQVDIAGCESPDACVSDTGVHVAIGYADTANSDQILSAQRTEADSPQGQSCTGKTIDSWLIETAADTIRVDVQNVHVTFPATLDSRTGLYGCSTDAVATAALGQACNLLTVVDATRVQ
jgi:hypothetical protein